MNNVKITKFTHRLGGKKSPVETRRWFLNRRPCLKHNVRPTRFWMRLQRLAKAKPSPTWLLCDFIFVTAVLEISVRSCENEWLWSRLKSKTGFVIWQTFQPLKNRKRVTFQKNAMAQNGQKNLSLFWPRELLFHGMDPGRCCFITSRGQGQILTFWSCSWIS